MPEVAQWHSGGGGGKVVALTIAQNKLSVRKSKTDMKYCWKLCDDIPK